MPEAYKLEARPVLFAEGKFEGELKAVTFVAASPNDLKSWSAINCGQFARFFRDYVPSDLADGMVGALRMGQCVTFPGTYTSSDFGSRFVYVHNGIPVT